MVLGSSILTILVLQIFDIVVSATAGILIPILAAFVSLIIWFHRRVNKVEKKASERQSAVFGGEGNPLNAGLVKEVKEIKSEVENLESEQSEMKDKQSKILAQLDALEVRLKQRGFDDEENE